MKRYPTLLAVLFALFSAHAQVTTAEVLGIAETRPHSEAGTALYEDGSVGEVIVRVRALDAGGNPVAGAAVAWVLTNSTTGTAYVVGSSADHDVPLILIGSSDLMVEGGMTDENGEAYLVVDSRSAGDVSMVVTVGELEAKTYDAGDMRVVWF